MDTKLDEAWRDLIDACESLEEAWQLEDPKTWTREQRTVRAGNLSNRIAQVLRIFLDIKGVRDLSQVDRFTEKLHHIYKQWLAQHPEGQA